MVTKVKSSVVEEAEKILERYEGWDLKEYTDAKLLPTHAKKIIKNLHKAALAKQNIAEFMVMVNELRRLQRDERWQQFRASYSKLREAMAKLINLPIFQHPSRVKERNEIIELMREEHVFDANILDTTVNKIGKIIGNEPYPEKISDANWNKIQQHTTQLLEKIRASVQVARRMKKVIEKGITLK